MSRRRLSMLCAVGNVPFLKPKPQALTSGATVMSKAPPVSRATSCAMLNTSVNMGSGLWGAFLLTAEMVDFSLKADSDASTRCSCALMPACRSESHW